MWVRPDGTDPETLVGEDDYWVAKLLEVRAIDPSHVYAKVSACIKNVMSIATDASRGCLDVPSGTAHKMC